MYLVLYNLQKLKCHNPPQKKNNALIQKWVGIFFYYFDISLKPIPFQWTVYQVASDDIVSHLKL